MDATQSTSTFIMWHPQGLRCCNRRYCNNRGTATGGVLQKEGYSKRRGTATGEVLSKEGYCNRRGTATGEVLQQEGLRYCNSGLRQESNPRQRPRKYGILLIPKKGGGKRQVWEGRYGCGKMEKMGLCTQAKGGQCTLLMQNWSPEGSEACDCNMKLLCTANIVAFIKYAIRFNKQCPMFNVESDQKADVHD